MVSIFDDVALDRLAAEARLDRHHLKQFRNALLKKQTIDGVVWATLPSANREKFSRSVDLHALTLIERLDSKIDGATKLLFQTRTGHVLETVILRIATGRTTLCVSSQVGCAAACQFCATGQMGLQKNLSAEEIVDQLVQANQLLAAENRKIRNIVFMGMGEPLHNEANVAQAIAWLTSPKHFAMDERRVLLSTVGIVEPLLRMGQRFPRLGIALSLHSARADVRSRIVPTGKTYSLAQLRNALQTVTTEARPQVMLEYVMLAGVNDAEDDLTALEAFCRDLTVHINLIPFNAVDSTHGLKGTSVEEQKRFATALKNRGFKVTLRYSLGADISAACGQLVKERMKRG